ncbi:hypothetical protein DEU56DRAFT_41389 [Suillus clintonianus]|uniref:uncharacterized protein n=1 Tax=Suillus clintonianus TaxID=1904413 RepID=UPI001B864365|nr:uncharacterized protein DEU56DRAFT_41389 [Suillus clintonianus]KAG2123992.1 hypothetical protein DEU56DRAFT_41389 [Suillus clintonianus]
MLTRRLRSILPALVPVAGRRHWTSLPSTHHLSSVPSSQLSTPLHNTRISPELQEWHGKLRNRTVSPFAVRGGCLYINTCRVHHELGRVTGDSTSKDSHCKHMLGPWYQQSVPYLNIVFSHSYRTILASERHPRSLTRVFETRVTRHRQGCCPLKSSDHPKVLCAWLRGLLHLLHEHAWRSQKRWSDAKLFPTQCTRRASQCMRRFLAVIDECG